MENLKILMWNYRYVIAVVVACIVYAIFEWENVKKLAYQLMIGAKRLAEKKILEAGQPEEDWVVDKLYELLPGRVTVFLNKDLLRKIVKKLYHAAKDLLDNGKMDDSI